MEGSLEIILNILQILVLIPLIFAAFGLVADNESPAFSALFTLAMVSLALEDVYWITYDLLRPGTHMPFAADEVAGTAVILLLAAASHSVLPETERDRLRIRQLVYAFVFMAANMLLWYAWSGEWFQDIVFGLPYIYLMYRLLQGIRCTRVLNRASSLFFMVLSALVLLLHCSALLTPPEAGRILDLLNYLLMFSVSAWFLLLSLKALRKREEGAVFLTFFTFFWTRIVIYMSGGVSNDLALFVNILTLPLMFVSVRDRVGSCFANPREAV